MNEENKRIENLFFLSTVRDNLGENYNSTWFRQTIDSSLSNLTITLGYDCTYNLTDINKSRYDFRKFDLILIVKKPIHNIHFGECNFKSLTIKTEDSGRVTDLVFRRCHFSENVEFDIICNSSISLYLNNHFKGDSLIIKAKNDGTQSAVPVKLDGSTFGAKDRKFNLEIDTNEYSESSLNFSNFNCSELDLKIGLKNLKFFTQNNNNIKKLKIEGLITNKVMPDVEFSGLNSIQYINFKNLGNIKSFNCIFNKIYGEINFENVQSITYSSFENAKIRGDIKGMRKINKEDFSKEIDKIRGDQGNISRAKHNKIYLKNSCLTYEVSSDSNLKYEVFSDSNFIGCKFEKFYCKNILLGIQGYSSFKDCIIGDIKFYQRDPTPSNPEYVDLHIQSSVINMIEILPNQSKETVKINCSDNSKIGMDKRKVLGNPVGKSFSGLFIKNCKKLTITNSEIFDCELVDCEFEVINFESVKFVKQLKIINTKSTSHNVEFRKLEFGDNISIESSGSFRALTKFCQDAGYEDGTIFFHKKELESRHNFIKKNCDSDSKVERFLLLFSKLFSDYGNSLFRPLRWIFCIFLMVLILLVLGDFLSKICVNNNHNPVYKNLDMNFRLSIRNAFFPFHYALPKNFVDEDYLKYLSWLSSILSFIHAVSSTIIWAIWFFMIRRRFRIG